MPGHDFERILMEAIDEGLLSLGESSKVAVYFHLQKDFNVRREEIPGNVEAFADAMEKIFGQGASFLEILIMQKLREKVRGASKPRDSDDLTFTEYVTFTRKDLMEKRV